MLIPIITNLSKYKILNVGNVIPQLYIFALNTVYLSTLDLYKNEREMFNIKNIFAT